jgi:hypothetical protein
VEATDKTKDITESMLKRGDSFVILEAMQYDHQEFEHEKTQSSTSSILHVRVGAGDWEGAS